MPRAMCVACGDLPAVLPLAVCASDRDDVHRSLIEISEWYDGLLVKPVRGKGRVGVNHAHPVLMADFVATLRTEMRDTLLAWATLHRDDAEPGPGALDAVLEELFAGKSIIELTSYLEAAGGFLMSHEIARDYVHEIQRLAHRAEQAGAPNRREGVVIGRHGDVDGEWECDGRVWAASLDGDGECVVCGLSRPVAWWRDKWPETDDDLLTDREAAAWLAIEYKVAIAPSQVRLWRHRGRIDPAPERRMGMVASTRGSLRRYAASRWTTVINA